MFVLVHVARSINEMFLPNELIDYILSFNQTLFISRSALAATPSSLNLPNAIFTLTLPFLMTHIQG